MASSVLPTWAGSLYQPCPLGYTVHVESRPGEAGAALQTIP